MDLGDAQLANAWQSNILYLTQSMDALMTTKLYWHDSHLTQFSAQVVDCFVQDGHQVVVLDQSAIRLLPWRRRAAVRYGGHQCGTRDGCRHG
jgi:hypothetical protein